MFKMEITFNKHKIIEDGQYTPEELTKQVDWMFQKLHIEKQDDGIYVGGDFAGHGGIILALREQAWFMDYVDKWLWFNSKGSDRTEDYELEDVAAHYNCKAHIRN